MTLQLDWKYHSHEAWGDIYRRNMATYTCKNNIKIASFITFVHQIYLYFFCFARRLVFAGQIYDQHLSCDVLREPGFYYEVLKVVALKICLRYWALDGRSQFSSYDNMPKCFQQFCSISLIFTINSGDDIRKG